MPSRQVDHLCVWGSGRGQGPPREGRDHEPVSKMGGWPEERTFCGEGASEAGGFRLSLDHVSIPLGFNAKSEQGNLPVFLKPRNILSRIPASDPENLAKTRKVSLSRSGKITAHG